MGQFDDVPEAAVEAKPKGIPVVWLLPIVALLVGGWLLYKTFSEKGPEITIAFKTAEGIEEGKTKLKYRDVVIGQVLTVRFSEDLSRVILTAELVPGTEEHLTETTQFWVVRPRVSAGEVSGLGTLLSGAYIAMDPGAGGKRQREFSGLEKPPVVTSDEAGTRYRLRAKQAGSLSVGAPVYFRQIVVGEVTDYALAEDHSYVDIGIFVRAPHDRYVRRHTRFWNVGGVDVAMDAAGVRVEMESFVALLSGGVAFETPESLDHTGQAPSDMVFALYDNHAKSVEQAITRSYPYVLNFSDTVRGLSRGAPVEFRGIRLGTVTDIVAHIGGRGDELRIPVLIRLEPERFMEAGALEEIPEDEAAQYLEQRLSALIEQGLRARLQTGNLLSGALFVELDIFPDAPPAELGHYGGYRELPTVPGTLTGITSSVTRLLDRLDKLPLEALVQHVDEAVQSTNSLLQALDRETPALAGELKQTAADARAMLVEASNTLESVERMASPEGEIGNELYSALVELRAAARSIRVMAEFLERHPEALLHGKSPGSQR